MNQAVKACAIAANYVQSKGLDLQLRPGFETIPGSHDGDISSVILIVTGT